MKIKYLTQVFDLFSFEDKSNKIILFSAFLCLCAGDLFAVPATLKANFASTIKWKNDTIISNGSIISFSPAGACAGEAVSVTITGTGFLLATSVTFNGVAATMTIDSDSQITTVVPAGASTGNIVIDIDSVPETSASPFTIYPLPTVAAIAGNATFCENTTTTLSDATVGGFWSSGNIAVATINSAGIVSSVSLGTSLISYTVTDGNGCVNSSSVTVTVNPKPVVAPITGTTSICVSTTTTLSDATIPGVWSSSNTAVATISSSGVVTGLSPGTSTISYQVTDGNNCTTIVTTTMTVNGIPVVSAISGTKYICSSNTTTTLIGSPAGGVWSSATPSVATVNPSTGVVTKVAAGTTNISYTFTASGCSSTQTATVTVYGALPTIHIGSPQTVCINNKPSMIKVDNPSPLPGGNSLYTYQWQRKDENNPTWQNINGAAGTGGPTYTGSTVNPGNGSTWYQLIITSGPCGSVTSNTLYIENVTDTGFKYSILNGPAAAVCPATLFTLLATSTHSSTAAAKFSWTANSTYITPATGGPTGTTGPISADGNYRTSTLDIPLTVQNNGTTTITTPITVTAIAYDYQNGVLGTALCAASPKSINVIIRPKPVATATVPSSGICTTSSADIVIRSNITDATTTFNWTRDNTANVTGASSGTSGAIAAGAPYTLSNILTNSTSTTQTVIYTITPTSNGCVGLPITVTITFQSTTWDGSSWSNGTPNIGMQAIINGNLTIASNFSACSLLVLSGAVQVNSGITATIQNGVTVSGGSLTFLNNASLVQINNTVNSGNITYERNTTPIRKFDYTYWSTPVNPQTLYNLSPTTLSDKYFWWNNAIYNWGYLSSSVTMTIGRGYIVRAPNEYDPVTTSVYKASFIGVPNNGDYSIPVTVSGANNLNLLGNPYPSAISANLLMSNPANSIALGTGTTIYFWTHNTPITANVYVPGDYASYNYTGGVGAGTAAANSGLNNSVPNGYIAAGQGFFIKGIASGNVTFKNSMRVGGLNTQFFRIHQQAQQIENQKNRIWLEMKNQNGGSMQTLIGYVENASNSFDPGYDGELLANDTDMTFYSVLNANKLSIQGRALPFEPKDLVSLGFHSTAPTKYSIAVSHIDGIFQTQGIYLEDKLLNTICDIKRSPYTFISSVGTFNDRFVLRYTEIKSNNTSQEVLALIIDKKLVITSSQNINKIEVFDITGKAVKTYMPSELLKIFQGDFVFAEGIFIARITLENNTVVSQKLVN